MSSPPHARREWHTWLLGAMLGLGVFLVFCRCAEFEFVDFDDPSYVYENRWVLQGLTPASVHWAWTTFDAANWHPLTWNSLQLDATLFGVGPRGFHLTNVLLHAISSVFLFGALHRLTRSRGLSLAAAVLFAVHPLRVESVAWISERKDVLSLFFGTLALWCYAYYAELPSWKRGLPVITSFALSLLAKPTLVTFPCVLLLLDFWPLNRLRRDTWLRLLLEKAPLFVLSMGSSIVTVLAQSHGGAISSEIKFPLEMRISNGALATVIYLKQTFWPFDLGAYYPHSRAHLGEPRVWGAISLLILLTGAAFWFWRRAPWLTVGWLWFLGTLVPVAGVVVQQGTQGHADRFMLWPHTGLWIAFVWGMATLIEHWRIPAAIPRLAASAVVLLLIWRTIHQTEIWCDTETLWRRTSAATGPNGDAESLLGQVYYNRGEKSKALAQFIKGVQVDPLNDLSHTNLAALLVEMGQLDQAAVIYRKLLAVNPQNTRAHNGLGSVLVRQGRDREARACFERVLQLKSNHAHAHYNLGLLMSNPLEIQEAQRHFEAALQASPEAGELHSALAESLEWQERTAEAEAEFREALRLEPGEVSAAEHLALLLERQNRSAEGLQVLQDSLLRNPKSAKLYLALGLIHESLGNVPASRDAFGHARDLDLDATLETGRLAWKLAVHPELKHRRPQRAAAGARQLIGVDPQNPTGFEILAAARAASGQFDEALRHVDTALALARNQPVILRRLEQERQAYRERRPWSEPALDANRAQHP